MYHSTKYMVSRALVPLRRDAIEKFDKERGEIEHVILSEAKDLRRWHAIRPGPQILRFAQNDMWRNPPIFSQTS